MKLYLCQVASPVLEAGHHCIHSPLRGNAEGSPPPSDAVLNFVFMANLAAQEATGDSAASTSPERVINRLKGSTESSTLLFPVIKDAAPLGEVSELGLPLVASRGEIQEMDYAGFIHIALPLLEEKENAEIECVLDVDYLPMPGETMTEQGQQVADWMAKSALELALKLGRRVAQVGVLSPAGQPESYDPMAKSYAELGFKKKHFETQMRVPVPENPPVPLCPKVLETQVWPDYDIPEPFLDDVLELLTVASTDACHGQLSVEPITWSRERLEQAHNRLKDRRAHTLLVAVIDKEEGKIISLCELSRQELGDPEVAEWTLTVTRRGYRRRGNAWLAKLKALSACAQYWPEVTRTYTSVAGGDKAMWNINQRLGAEPISTSQALELRILDS